MPLQQLFLSISDWMSNGENIVPAIFLALLIYIISRFVLEHFNHKATKREHRYKRVAETGNKRFESELDHIEMLSSALLRLVSATEAVNKGEDHNWCSHQKREEWLAAHRNAVDTLGSAAPLLNFIDLKSGVMSCGVQIGDSLDAKDVSYLKGYEHLQKFMRKSQRRSLYMRCALLIDACSIGAEGAIGVPVGRLVAENIYKADKESRKHKDGQDNSETEEESRDGCDPKGQEGASSNRANGNQGSHTEDGEHQPESQEELLERYNQFLNCAYCRLRDSESGTDDARRERVKMWRTAWLRSLFPGTLGYFERECFFGGVPKPKKEPEKEDGGANRSDDASDAGKVEDASAASQHSISGDAGNEGADARNEEEQDETCGSCGSASCGPQEHAKQKRNIRSSNSTKQGLLNSLEIPELVRLVAVPVLVAFLVAWSLIQVIGPANVKEFFTSIPVVVPLMAICVFSALVLVAWAVSYFRGKAKESSNAKDAKREKDGESENEKGNKAKMGPRHRYTRPAVVVILPLVAALAAFHLAVFLTSTPVTNDPVVRETVNDYSWEELSQISEKISNSQTKWEAVEVAIRYNLCTEGGLDGSQVKSVKLTNGKTLFAQIVGFYHDEKTGGGNAGITFIFSGAIAERSMNPTNTNSGGWRNSEMRAWLMTEGINLLPEDLRACLVGVKKRSIAPKPSGRSPSVEITCDRLWLYSRDELFGYDGLNDDGVAPQQPPPNGSKYMLYRDTGTDAKEPNGVLDRDFENSSGERVLKAENRRRPSHANGGSGR